MLEQVQRTIEEYHMAKGGRLIVGLSGGADPYACFMCCGSWCLGMDGIYRQSTFIMDCGEKKQTEMRLLP